MEDSRLSTRQTHQGVEVILDQRYTLGLIISTGLGYLAIPAGSDDTTPWDVRQLSIPTVDQAVKRIFHVHYLRRCYRHIWLGK